MEWVVEYHEEYLIELRAEPEAVQVAVFAAAGVLQRFGPQPVSYTHLNKKQFAPVTDRSFHMCGFRVTVNQAFGTDISAEPEGIA